MDMPDTLGGLVLAFALESEQPGVRADVRRLVIEAGVLRPETTAREIIAATRPSCSTRAASAPLTRAERRSLERRAARLREELFRIEERLAAE